MTAVITTGAGSSQTCSSGWTFDCVASLRGWAGGRDDRVTAWRQPSSRLDVRPSRAPAEQGRERERGDRHRERDGGATMSVAAVLAKVAGRPQVRSSDRAFDRVCARGAGQERGTVERLRRRQPSSRPGGPPADLQLRPDDELSRGLRSGQERETMGRWRRWQPSARLWQAARRNAAPAGRTSKSRACGAGKRERWWGDGVDGSRPHDRAGRQQICSSYRTINRVACRRSGQERETRGLWRRWQPSARLWQAARRDAAPAGRTSKSLACGAAERETVERRRRWQPSSRPGRPPAGSQLRPDARPSRVPAERGRERGGRATA